MNRLLHLIPSILVILCILGLALKSEEYEDVPVFKDQGSSLDQLVKADTLETGRNYFLGFGDVKTKGIDEDSVVWCINRLSSVLATPQFVREKAILQYEFIEEGDYKIQVLKNQKLVAWDTLSIYDGFNDGVRNFVPGRVLVDSIFKVEDYTENAVNRTWRITAMDSVEYQVLDTTLESGTLQLTLSKAGDYRVALSVENENGKRQDSDPVVLEVYRDKPDIDTDGDGIVDSKDLFPDDDKEWADSDLDSYGDNKDKFPNDPSEWYDLDRDGIGNNSDDDIDGDGYTNDEDCFDYNRRLHKCPTEEESTGVETTEVEDSEKRGCWGKEPDLEGSNEITSGFNSPLRDDVEFRSGDCSIIVKPQINLRLKSFDYWPGPGIGTGVQICTYRIESINCLGEGTVIQRPFSTPQNNNRSEQRSCGQILLAGNTYKVTLSTKDDARLGFIPVAHAERKKVIENKLEMEYEGSQTAIFELIFEN